MPQEVLLDDNGSVKYKGGKFVTKGLVTQWEADKPVDLSQRPDTSMMGLSEGAKKSWRDYGTSKLGEGALGTWATELPIAAFETFATPDAVVVPGLIKGAPKGNVIQDILPGIRSGVRPQRQLPEFGTSTFEMGGATKPTTTTPNINQLPLPNLMNVRGAKGRRSVEEVIVQPDESLLGVETRKVYNRQGEVIPQGPGKVVKISGKPVDILTETSPLNPKRNPEWDPEILDELEARVSKTNLNLDKFKNADEVQEAIDQFDRNAGVSTLKNYIKKEEPADINISTKKSKVKVDKVSGEEIPVAPIQPKAKGVAPGLRAKIFRGMNDSVDAFFPDEFSRQIFGAGQRIGQKTNAPELAQRFNDTSNKVANDFGLDPQTARGKVIEYNKFVRDLAKKQAKFTEDEPLSFRVPSFGNWVGGAKGQALSPNAPVLPNWSNRGRNPKLAKAKEMLQSLVKNEEGSLDLAAMKSEIKRLFYDESGMAGKQDYRPELYKQFAKAIDQGGDIDIDSLYEPWKGKMSETEFIKHAENYIDNIYKDPESLFRSTVTAKNIAGEPQINLPTMPLENETSKLFDEGPARIKQPEGKSFSTMDEVIENIDSRSDLSPRQKAGMKERLTAVDIAPNGALPLDPARVGVMDSLNSWAKTGLTFDIPFMSSAAGRQGLPLWYTKAFRNSLDDMVKSYGSSKFFHGLMEGIKNDPLFATKLDENGQAFTSIAEQAGLHLPGVWNKLKDERFAQNWLAERAPFRANERAFHGFINKLRADHFKTLYESAKAGGVDVTNLDFLKSLADTVNIATGHGNLGRFSNARAGLNKYMFSPSYTASKLNMVDITSYANIDPFVRKEKIKNLIALVTASQALGSLSYFAGEMLGAPRGVSSLENVKNPKEWGDFGRTTFGNKQSGKTSFDSGAGILQPMALEAQLVMGVAKVLSNQVMGTRYKTDDMQQNFIERGSQYAINRLNPAYRFIANMATNRGFASDPKDGFNIINELASNVSPILLQDVIDGMEANPELWPIIIPMSAFGQGASSYTK